MKKYIGDSTKKIIGIVLIVIGIFGLFLPFLQGILLIIIGIALYENKSVREAIKNFIDKVKRKKENVI